MQKLLFQFRKVRAKRLRAFTLIELLVVITIIGILMTLVVVTIGPIQKRSRDSKRKADVNLFISGITLFQADFKLYPNYTYLLGSSTTVGEKNSTFDLGSDLAKCTSNTTAGVPSSFAHSASAPVGDTSLTLPAGNLNSATTYNSAVLRPGFASVNHLLVCLKYLDRMIVDPKPNTTNPEWNYQYRISYDYSQYLVSSQAENVNDPSLVSNLFPAPSSPIGAVMDSSSGGKRYFEGNGRNVMQLDDSSDIQAKYFGLDPEPQSNASRNGRYYYQCVQIDEDPGTMDINIKRDNRSLAIHEPITSLNGVWVGSNICAGGMRTGFIQMSSYYGTTVQSH